MFESTQTDISAALSVPASMGSVPARLSGLTVTVINNAIATATYRLLINSNIADDRRPVVACATLRAEENRATTIFFRRSSLRRLRT